MNNRVYVFPSIFPTPETEAENRVILLKVGSNLADFVLMTDKIPDLTAAKRFPMLPLLHLRRKWDKPPRKHHRLGVSTIPHITKTRQSPSGTSSIMSTASCITPNTVSGIRQTSSGTCHAYRMPPIFGASPKRGGGWGKSTSPMRRCPNIRYISSKTVKYQSIGA